MKLYNPKFPNIYVQKDKRGRESLFTIDSTPDVKLFDDDTIKIQGTKYRHFDARRSKLAAGILKGLSQIGLREDQDILYLGASHGYTPSFVSDILGNKGRIYALDFAPRVVRDLVFLCETRRNMIPILGDANRPDTYKERITPVDFVFQDVAQKNQAEIFLKNISMFLNPGGFGMLAVKSRSVDITRNPKQIYAEIRQKLEKETTVVDFKVLDPYEKDHCVFVVKRK